MGTRLKIQFDFEKSYLCDVLAWSDLITEPEILINKFQDNAMDGELVYSIFSQLDSIIRDTKLVREGMFCGHYTTMIPDRHDTEDYNPNGNTLWEINKDGRIWSALDLLIDREETLRKRKKLIKLLRYELEILERLNRCRQGVIESFYCFDKRIRKRSSRHRNLFSEGQKLDERVNKYRELLQEEIKIRNMMAGRLSSPSKGLKKYHKRFLEAVVSQLRQFVTLILEGCEIEHKSKDINGNNVHQYPCLFCDVMKISEKDCISLVSDDVDLPVQPNDVIQGAPTRDTILQAFSI